MGATFVGMPAFPTAARAALADPQLRRNLAHATTTIRAKRARAVAEVDDWEDLRRAGAAIKDHTLAHLGEYLLQFEERFTAAGGHVHWARDAEEADRIVVDLVAATGQTEVVKVKSMVTMEIGLNEALERAGIRPIETDLAELIVQLGEDLPSHILVPAIHRNRGEIRDLFRRAMPGAPADLTDRPAELAAAARAYLRERFLSAKVAVSGANFLVAESGTLVVVESEGNGRMCLTLPQTLISVVGIEKTIPTWQDLEVFLQLLPRSSTAERMNPYTSTWSGPFAAGRDPGDDGPRDVHVVLLDNGRTRALADPVGRQALRCIRCSACLNSCPVYERVGGKTYGSVYPGPIGAVLNPLLRGVDAGPVERSLPFASTLCGRCLEVCPMLIDLPEILVQLRGRVVESGHGRGRPDGPALPDPAAHHSRRRPHGVQDLVMACAAWVFGGSRRLAVVQRGLRAAARLTGRRPLGPVPIPGPALAWTRARDLPPLPGESFRTWWFTKDGQGAEGGGPEDGEVTRP